MNTVLALSGDTGSRVLRTHSDPDSDSHWCFMHAERAAPIARRPCFHLLLIKEIREFQMRLCANIRQQAEAGLAPLLGHVVLASDAPVFNLGGDLDLFARLIRARDRQHLMAYARSCVEGVYAFHAGLDVGLHSVALVQGDALGGGFEAALSCNTIVAEAGVGMGLPEVLFDLFPGMGAYSFLSRRVGPTQAERMMLSGNIYSSEELYKLGVVDVLAPKGEGAAAVEDVIRRNRRIPHARRAMQRVAQVGGSPITLDELMRITEIWVDTAMRLGEKSLRTMERLVRAQTKRANGEPGDEAAPAVEALVAERLVARNS